MMTTDTSEQPRPAPLLGGRVLGGAAVTTLAAGLVMAALGAALSGWPAAAGAVVGATIVTLVMALGTFPMNLVAGVMPRLSLAFAVLTYFFQLVVLIAALVALDQAGLVGDELSRGWLGAALLVGVGSWVVAHIALASKARIPIYHLGATPAATATSTAAPTTTDPGAR